jgi:hypothetical protein
VWLLVDLLVSGDPLASLHRARTIMSVLAPRFEPMPLGRLPWVIWSALGRSVGVLVVSVGAVGVLLQARRGIARKSFDPVPLAVLVVWVMMIAIETRTVLFQDRYLYAATMPLLLGVAVVVGTRLPDRLKGGRALATLGAVITFALATQSMPAGTSLLYRELVAAVPAIDRALACDPIGITGYTSNSFARRPGGLAPVLAAVTRHGLNQFKVNQTQPDLSAVLVLGGRRRHRPDNWVGPRLGFGTLAVSPSCDRETRA